MKKVLALMLAVLVLVACAGCNTVPAEREWHWEETEAAPLTGVTINVYNWGEYIDNEILDVNAAFTHMTGIKVNYKTFENNEAMYTTVSSGAAEYDVLFPSDYMLARLINEGRVNKLNFDNIPNYANIDAQFKGLACDPTGEYSVPYTWGTVGIFYNTKYVDEADLEQGWDLLWNEKYNGRILMFDNPRDSFAIALNKLGYSINSENPDEWQAAFKELERQRPLLNGYVNDQVYSRMINEEAYIAPYYAGDANIMIYDEAGNEDIKFFIPESGTNFFTDLMCISSTTSHQTEAEAYINFMCQTEVAKANAEYIGYSTPVKTAREALDPDVAGNPWFYPSDEVLANTEIFLQLPTEINNLMSELWHKVK